MNYYALAFYGLVAAYFIYTWFTSRTRKVNRVRKMKNLQPRDRIGRFSKIDRRVRKGKTLMIGDLRVEAGLSRYGGSR